MALYFVQRAKGLGGVTVKNDSDTALVVAASAAAARTAAAADQPGGAAAWAGAEAWPVTEDNVTANGGVIRLQTTSETPNPFLED